MLLGAGIFRTSLPIGFSAGGINCGVRYYRPDIGLIVSEVNCVATAVFTKNICKGAPIKYCQKILPSKKIKAVVTNSGQANAMTGALGDKNNQLMVNSVAEVVGCDSDQVVSASTGVIGEQLAIEKICKAAPELYKSLTNVAEKFAVSVMTTDLVPKTVVKKLMLSQGEITITGISKGSGMIHPNMATMLGYILSDVYIDVDDSQAALKQACDDSFNMISVDGETSTNDCVFLLSNGMSGVGLDSAQDKVLFEAAIKEVSIVLAKSIARDGEGASKLIEVTVSGMEDQELAKEIARSITTSPLIKTAIYGGSANWGRVLSRLGMSALTLNQIDACEVFVQKVPVYSKGVPMDAMHADHLKNKMKDDTVDIEVVFPGAGKKAVAWGCDLTERYVKINAEYTT